MDSGANLRTNGLPAPLASTASRLERIGSLTRYRCGQSIYFQDQCADSWYRVVSGAARECTLTADGRRQVVDFLLPGDLFGFCGHRTSRASAEVIVEATVLASYPRRRAEQLAESEPLVARYVRGMAFESIERLRARTVLLGRNNSVEKVSAFLLELASRSPADSGGAVALPMSRYDIADYLALAVETVSRALTTLRQLGAITLLGTRRVLISDRAQLLHLGASVLRLAESEEEWIEGHGSIVSRSIDEKRRCIGDTAVNAAHEVGLDSRRMGAPRQVADERRHVEA